MKRTVRILSLCLSLCLLAAAAPASAASVNTAEWLSILEPEKTVERRDVTSFEARLEVSMQGYSATLRGTCSIEGELTDEDLLEAIERGVAAVGEYGSPEDAVEDQMLIYKLNDKLKISEADQKQLIRDWLRLTGMDKVYDMLHLTRPSYGVEDAITVVAESIWKGELPGLSSLAPFPTGMSGFAIGGVVNGTVVSWEAYQRDKERYQNIVELANAKARLRRFNAAVREFLLERQKERQAWTIRIQDGVTQDQMYMPTYDISAPYDYSSDIVLTKKGGLDSPAGVYNGSFLLNIEVELWDFDMNFAKYLADKYTRSSGGRLQYHPVSMTVHRPSESMGSIGGDDLSLRVALPPGVLRTVLEYDVDLWKMQVLKEASNFDFVAEVACTQPGADIKGVYTMIQSVEENSSYVHLVFYNNGVKSTEDGQSGPYPDLDARSLLRARLVLDMMEVVE